MCVCVCVCVKGGGRGGERAGNDYWGKWLYEL